MRVQTVVTALLLLISLNSAAVAQSQPATSDTPTVDGQALQTHQSSQAEPTVSAPPTVSTASAPTPSTTSAVPEAALEDGAGPTPEQRRAAQQFYDSLHRQTGSVLVAGGKVRLQIPPSHYFVGPEDSRRIIVDQWRNPPNVADGIEGMIFADGANPVTGAWGAVVSYSPDGYVSDQDASSTDYNDLLRQMQEDTSARNAERQHQGYPAITLVGWAEPPHYDAPSHKVYWARELAFSDSQLHSLNYDIRVLGRGGVLSINFIAAMDELQEIRSAAPAVMAIPEFTPGNRYADYQEGADPRAAYGIAGLIAGGALAAVAQKTGLLAIILLAAKKFIVVILAGFAALGGVVRRMFGGRKSRDEAPPPET